MLKLTMVLETLVKVSGPKSTSAPLKSKIYSKQYENRLSMYWPSWVADESAPPPRPTIVVLISSCCSIFWKPHPSNIPGKETGRPVLEAKERTEGLVIVSYIRIAGYGNTAVPRRERLKALCKQRKGLSAGLYKKGTWGSPMNEFDCETSIGSHHRRQHGNTRDEKMMISLCRHGLQTLGSGRQSLQHGTRPVMVRAKWYAMGTELVFGKISDYSVASAHEFTAESSLISVATVWKVIWRWEGFVGFEIRNRVLALVELAEQEFVSS
ncbi:hypothetical protein CRG98_002142 [Punica granatum]|uniref:Uncharacterized protein n=1 Tax=Punica granatum TaxID=22663 RepID=A0A2I0LBH9_PUNGR|nr:hypothetical protein CRG98_002142 [Punica granatum]